MDILSSLKSRLEKAKSGFSNIVSTSLKGLNTWREEGDTNWANLKKSFDPVEVEKAHGPELLSSLQNPLVKEKSYVGEYVEEKFKGAGVGGPFPFVAGLGAEILAPGPGGEIGFALGKVKVGKELLSQIGDDGVKQIVKQFGKKRASAFFSGKADEAIDVVAKTLASKKVGLVNRLPKGIEMPTDTEQIKTVMEAPKEVIDSLADMSKQSLSDQIAIKSGLPLGGEAKKVTEIASDTLKQSKFVETVKKSSIVPEASKEKFDLLYKPLSETSAIENARDLVSKDYNRALELVRSDNAVPREWVATMEALIERAFKEGRIDDGDELISALGKGGTQYGQAIDMFKVLSRMTPAGMTRFVGREFERIGRSILNPKMERVKSIVGRTRKVLEDSNKEAVERISKEVAEKAINPEELLGKRIVGSLPNTVAKPDPIKDMVSTLFKVYREINPSTSSKAQDTMAFVRQALKDKEAFRKTWEGSKDKVKELLIKKYGQDPGAVEHITENLEQYFKHYLDTPFSQAQGKRVVSEEMKTMGIQISEVVRQHYSQVSGIKGDLVSTLVRKTGLDTETAQGLANFASKRFDELTSAKKKQILETMFREKGAIKVEKALIDRVVELSNLGAFEESSFYNQIGQKIGIPVLTKEKGEMIVKMMDAYQTAGSESAKKEIMRDLLSNLGKDLPSSFIDKVESQFFGNVLSGPATHLVNTLGNLGRTLWDVGSHPSKVVLDIAESKLTNTQREVFMKEWGPELIGGVQGMRNGLREAIRTFKSGVSPRDIENFNIPKTPIGGRYGRAVASVGKALKAEDVFFSEINKTAYLYKKAYNVAIKEGLTGDALTRRAAELITTPTDDMLAGAEKFAQKLTFQDAGGDIEAFTKLRDMGTELPGDLGKLKPGRFVIPFIRSVSNVAKFGLIETTPVGLVTTALNWKNLERVERNRRLASSAMGAVELAAIASYFGEGRIIGAFPSNKTEREALYAEGVTGPYSIKIGDTWVQYNRFPEPLATHLSLVAAFYDEYNKTGKEPTPENLAAVMFSVGKGYEERTFLTGLGNMLDALEDPQRYGEAFLANIAVATGVPFSSLVGAGARALDRTVREPENVLERAMSRVPGLSTTLEPKPNRFEPGGESVRKGSPIEEFLPFRTSPVTRNPQATNYKFNLYRKRLNSELKDNLASLDASYKKDKISKEEWKEKRKKLTSEYQNNLSSINARHRENLK